MRKAVFWDRDGVINKVILRDGRPASPRKFGEFELYKEAKEVLEKFRRKGFLNIIVTNQPDIARGLASRKISQRIHRFITENLSVDDIYVCPHDDKDNCRCRKPKPGMLLKAARKWRIDLKNSFMVGDMRKDTESGKRAGCAVILINRSYNREDEADFKVNNLRSVAKVILKKEENVQ